MMHKISNGTIRALILDMDGVLWKGEHPIGNLPEIFEFIDQLGLRVILATNNAIHSIKQYINKLSKFGVLLDEWQIINSSQATVHYLLNKYPERGPVYIVGENGLHITLEEQGFYHSTNNALAVVAGLDRTITYEKLKTAALLIRSGAEFIGTNPDKTYPLPEGLAPGAGSILASLEAATDEKPTTIGKPAPYMYLTALERLGTNPEETLVVGDRLETDIAGAQALGCMSGLVLSGVTDLAMAKSWEPAPDIIAKDLESLLNVRT
jgi:4-nitrophenyl phosphatase